MNTVEAAALIKLSLGPWPQFKFNPETISSFVFVLEDIPFLEAQEAVVSLLKDALRTYPPTPGEICAEALRLKKSSTALSTLETELLETYTREVKIGNKTETRAYIRASSQFRQRYRERELEAGRQYRESKPQTQPSSDRPCSIPSDQMKLFREMLHSLTNKFAEAHRSKSPESLERCNAEALNLKQLYW